MKEIGYKGMKQAKAAEARAGLMPYCGVTEGMAGNHGGAEGEAA